MSALDDLELPPDLPKAYYFRIYSCGNNDHAHIVLFHADDTPIAQFTVDKNNIDSIVHRCERIFRRGDDSNASTDNERPRH